MSHVTGQLSHQSDGMGGPCERHGATHSSKCPRDCPRVHTPEMNIIRLAKWQWHVCVHVARNGKSQKGNKHTHDE